MGKIHVGQTALDIIRTVGTDITGATPVKIKYIKPSKENGEWTATITDAVTGEITYQIATSGDLDQYGTWIIWAHVTLANGKVAAGEASRLIVYKEGEL